MEETSLKLTIDGRSIEARAGQTILEAARENGIEIPSLCYHPDLPPVGSCRLCVVEVEGWPGPVASCTLPVAEGMSVRTETPALARSRRSVLSLLLLDYADSAEAAGERPETEFMRWVKHYDARAPAGARARWRVESDSDPNPVVGVDFGKCILCTRCVRACAEIQGRSVWSVGHRGAEARIVAGADTDLLTARCESCGACVAYCPTGALEDKMSRRQGKPDRVVTTTCPYCGVGCNFDLHVAGGEIIRVASNPAAPVNGMHLCVKGRYGYDFVQHPDRLTAPRVRKYLMDGAGRDPGGDRGPWVETDWDTALGIVAAKLFEVKQRRGPEAVAFLSSAKCTNEENYLMQKLARQVVGTHNIDHCARLCHASTVAGLAACFGSGAMSNTMRDVAEEAQAFLIIGSNTTEQHPVFGSMIRRAVRRRGAKLVVADPRRIDITELATLHLRHRPGTDVALVNGLMHIILRNGWHDREYIEERTEDFASFEETVAKYTPEAVSRTTGVPADELRRASELLSRRKPMAVIWAMGITQHTTGVLNVLSLGNLQMLLGNMGVAGGGVNPLRGQNNVQGACDLGCLPNVFPGYQAIADPAVREKFSRAWQLSPASTLTDRAGLTVTEMINLAGRGKIEALYILAENPAMSDPDSNHVRDSLEGAGFVALQEIFPSETSAYADVLLPGSAWAERSGTFTNTERRIQLIRRAVDPPGEARPDWDILRELARRLLELEGRHPAGPQAGWDYGSPAEIMDEIASLTPSYTGVSHLRLERGEALHWPVTGPDHPGTPILHIGRFTRGRGKFHSCEHLPPEELPDEEYPVLLTTGRVLYHWHGAEMTRRARSLRELCPETLVEISPADAARIGLNGNRRIRVVSRRGEMTAKALITERVTEGLLFGNFHFPGPENVNNLTIAALDPVAKIPEYKVCAVRVEAL